MLYVLEEVFKSKKNENSEHFNLRIQRALSWLKKAAYSQDDVDIQFLSLWISLNAIYVTETAEDASIQLNTCLQRIYQQDHDQKINHFIWHSISDQVQRVLDNPYTFQDYWEYKNQKITQLTWKTHFEVEKQRIFKAFKYKEGQTILNLLFERMLTLRNQMLLGGNSYKSAINRQQLKDSCHILLVLIPAFLQVLIENAKCLEFDRPFYPIMHMS